MNAEYRAVLDGRQEQLLKRVKWSKDLIKGLVSRGLVTRDCMRKMEMERCESKALMIMMQLKMCKEPNTFQNFCELLASTGNEEVAESLIFDKDRIKWGFVKDEKAANPAEFLTLFDADLFAPFAEEKDRFKRTAQLQEARRRLKECIRHMKSSRGMEVQFKSNLLQLHQTKEAKRQCERLTAVENIKSFEDMEKEQNDLSLMIHSHLSDYIQDLNDQILTLRNENKHLQNQSKDLKEFPEPVMVPHSDLGKKQVEILKKALEEQDRKFLELKVERKKSLDERLDFHSVSTSGVRKMQDMFKAAYRDYKIDFNEDTVDVTELLVGGVEMLIGQMDRMRARAKQAADHTTQLEKDRGLSLAILKVSDGHGTRLSESIKSKMGELEKAVQLGQEKNKTYAIEIGFLAEDNENLKEKCKSLEDKIKVWLEGTTSTATTKHKPKASNGKNWKV